MAALRSLCLLTLAIAIYTRESGGKTLQVLFPLKFFKPDSRLVDVTNLNTVYEYYLVESLAAGLLRDTPTSQDGYTPLLAESWHQPKPNEWQFKIRTDLTWSNGEPLTGEQIANHFNRISRRESRHLLALKRLEATTFNAEQQILTMMFHGETNSSLLHELSLADAVVTYPGPRGDDWSVTSGAYSVDHYDPAGLVLDLKINPNSITANATSPKSIHLFYPKDKSKLIGAFKEYPVDLYSQPAQPYRKMVRTIRQQAKQIYPGHPNTISFFSFNPKHELATNEAARKALGTIVSEAFRSFPWDDSVQYDEQLIPPGYAGHINRYTRISSPGDALSGKSVLLIVPAGFRELPDTTLRLKSVAKTHGAELEIAYADDDLPATMKPFASFRNFKGNQVDPAGSWNFLFNGEDSELGMFLGEVSKLLSTATMASDEGQRNKILEELHRQVLDRAYAIPFMIEADAILASDRVTLNNINPFDLRLRFYDVVWK